MSIQIKNRRLRVQSAKPTLELRRNIQDSNKYLDKNQFIQKIYNQIPHLHDRPVSGKKKIKTSNMITSYVNNNTARTSKNINYQNIIDENILLKKRNNQLEEEIMMINNKFQALHNKRNKKDNNNINAVFQNQNLWAANNAYLVTGVKNQYQNLKLKLKQKNDQLIMLKNQLQSTKYLQLQKQNVVLKQQNHKLIQNLLREQNRNKTITSTKLPNYDYKALQLLSEQLSYKNQQLNKKIQKIQKKYKQTEQLFKSQQVKINFLQKLIIQKDNQLHAIHRKLNSQQKTIQTKNNQNQQLKNHLKSIENQYQTKIFQIQSVQQQKRLKQNQIFQKIINDKSLQIQKLQKQIAYLTTLMSYWKPLDQQNKSKNSKEQSIIKSQRQKQRIQSEIHHKNNQNMNNMNINISKNVIFSQSIKQNSLKQLKVNSQISEPIRTVKKADKKRSQYSQKVRVVKIHEVQQIGQLLRYKLIAQRIQPQKIFSLYLQHKANPNLTQQQNKWQTQYINIKQCKKILESQPFSLLQQQSRLLSRYLVEDVVQDYLYYDEQNQNKRKIVQSILKNLIGEYQINKSLQEIQKLTNIQVDKYKSKISTMLEQMYPEGVISKKKLLEIFNGSGFEISQQIMDYILGKIIIKSSNINQLKYKILF